MRNTAVTTGTCPDANMRFICSQYKKYLSSVHRPWKEVKIKLKYIIMVVIYKTVYLDTSMKILHKL